MEAIKRDEDRNQGAEAVTVTQSSGNVFADLGLPNPEERIHKSELVLQISHVIRQRRLTQVNAAALMGISQPDLSKLLRGRASNTSLDKLISMLTALGATTRISVELPPRYGEPGRVVIEGVATSLKAA